MAQLIKKLLCRFGWHTWTRWSTAKFSLEDGSGIQYRECVCCGKMQRHVL